MEYYLGLEMCMPVPVLDDEVVLWHVEERVKYLQCYQLEWMVDIVKYVLIVFALCSDLA